MLGLFRKTQEVFADHAAGSPLLGGVRTAMLPWMDASWNPSAIHPRGVGARGVIETARKSIAEFLYAHPDEIVFTSSGTEAIHLAIHSATLSHSQETVPHVITTSIEHHAVLHPLQTLAKEGKIILEYLPILASGIVDVGSLASLIRSSTVLVAVMYANNELGTVQPIRAVTKIVRDHKKKTQTTTPHVLTDACQVFSSLECHVERLGVDYLVLNSAKVGGPQGTALLYVRRGAPVRPLFLGGAQERGRRAGTENVAGIIGFAKALAIAQEDRKTYERQVGGLRDTLAKDILAMCPDAHVNGSSERLSGHLSVTFPDADHQYLALALGAKGIMVGTKSACRENEDGDSHVLMALRKAGDAPELPAQAIRISLGKENTRQQMGQILAALKKSLPLARASKSVE